MVSMTVSGSGEVNRGQLALTDIDWDDMLVMSTRNSAGAWERRYRWEMSYSFVGRQLCFVPRCSSKIAILFISRPRSSVVCTR